jgi:hypothetical protein
MLHQLQFVCSCRYYANAFDEEELVGIIELYLIIGIFVGDVSDNIQTKKTSSNENFQEAWFAANINQCKLYHVSSNVNKLTNR